jgi:hypothetical protein
LPPICGLLAPPAGSCRIGAVITLPHCVRLARCLVRIVSRSRQHQLIHWGKENTHRRILCHIRLLRDLATPPAVKPEHEAKTPGARMNRLDHHFRVDLPVVYRILSAVLIGTSTLPPCRLR